MVNVTRDVSLMVLKITLMSIFGDDYETAAPEFKFFAEDAARDFKFAQNLGPLRELVLLIVAQRRRENRVFTDSLGVMMQARDRDGGEPMSDAQLAREVLNLVVTGHRSRNHC
jgi:cytochrome P450